MALVKGICKNFGECDLADNKEIQEVDKTNFVCEECGKPLHPLEKGPTPGGGGKGKLIGIIAAIVAILAATGAGVYFFLSGGQEIAEIKLDKKELTLVVGETPTDIIKASVYDKDGKVIKDAKVAFEWESSDKKVATVNEDGEVTAIEKGETSITVKIDGNEKVSAAQCRVEVKEKEKAPEPIYISKLAIKDGKDFSLKKGGTQQLEYIAEPNQSSETPAWESSDPSVATVDANGLVAAVKKGTAKITVKAQNVTSTPITVKVTEETGTPTDDGNGWGKINLGYGIYEGERRNNKPHGHGTIRYTTSYQIVSWKDFKASPGDTFEGNFRDGKISGLGYWKHNGNVTAIQ